MGLVRTLCLAFILLVADSFMMSDNGAASGAASSPQEGAGDVPLLPETDPNSNIPSIKLGETISFEEMGPIILNSDGSTRRIDNWDQLTDHEKEVTWRRISKRNEQRRKKLLQQQQEQAAAEETAKKKNEL